MRFKLVEVIHLKIVEFLNSWCLNFHSERICNEIVYNGCPLKWMLPKVWELQRRTILMLLIQLQSEMCWEIISWKLGLKQKSKSNNRIWKTELFLRFNKFNIHSPKWFNWANTHLRFYSTIDESVGADTRFCQRAEKWQELLSMKYEWMCHHQQAKWTLMNGIWSKRSVYG